MDMMGNWFLSMKCPFDFNGDFPSIPPVNYESLKFTNSTNFDATSIRYVSYFVA